MKNALLPQRAQAMEIHTFSCHSGEYCKKKEIRASSNVTELSQHHMFFTFFPKIAKFLDPPKYEKTEVLSQKTQAKSKKHCNYARFVLAKASKTL